MSGMSFVEFSKATRSFRLEVRFQLSALQPWNISVFVIGAYIKAFEVVLALVTKAELLRNRFNVFDISPTLSPRL